MVTRFPDPADDRAATLLLDPAVIDDPYPFYDHLREHAPVWRVPGTDVFVVTSFEALTDAVGRPADFSSNLGVLLYRTEAGTPAVVPFGGEDTNVLATADPPLHTLHRATVFPELMNKRMTALRPEVEALANERVDAALGEDRVEFMEAVANAVPIRVISRLVGWEDENPELLFQAALDSSSVLSATRSLDDVHAAIDRTATVAGWIAEQLQHSLDSGADGLLGIVADAVRADQLDLMAGLIILHTLLSAGGESTTSLIGNAVHHLATDTDLQERLRSDPALVPAFIEEMLRLESPFRYHLRQVRHATRVGGIDIPDGSAVLLMWGAANRDPAEYDRPDEVVLERPTLRHHVAFGRGIHHCVGAPLARLETGIVLTQLLGATRHFEVDPDLGPRRDNSLMVRRFAALPLRVEPAISPRRPS